MTKDSGKQRTYLAVDQLAENPRLARRLTPEVAMRFHALPVAEDNGRLTVAMADPTDVRARDAVLGALGSAACVVRGDAGTIDAMLSRIWAGTAGDPPLVRVCSFPLPISEPVSQYVEALAALLDTRIEWLTTDTSIQELSRGGREGELVVFGRADHPQIRPLLTQRPAATATTSTLPFGLLIAERPRWPLERILLVAQGATADDAALDWVLRLARAAMSAVTVLVVVPPVPAMYGGRELMGQGLPNLLSADSPLGKQMRRTSQRLVDWEVPGTLRLREGLPDRQVCREAIEGDYDLIVLAWPCSTWWQRCLEGDLIGPLLRRVSRPVLAVKPKTQ